MTVPRFIIPQNDPSHPRIAVDVAGVQLTHIANQTLFALVCLLAHIALEVQSLLHILGGDVLELPLLYCVLLSIGSIVRALGAAVGAFARALQPLLQTRITEGVFAAHHNPILKFPQTNRAHIVLNIPQFL
jgi:hypothetical protein